MTKEKTAKKITAETVKAAVRNCTEGERYELTDLYCRGLQLRVSAEGVKWTVRARLHNNQRRWIIGGSDIPPEKARERAAEVRAWCHRGSDPEKLVTEFMTGISIAHQVRVSGERPPRSWMWLDAVDKFLNHIIDCRSPDTYDDYARTLGSKRRLDGNQRHSHVPELERFSVRMVSSITREEIAECIADVCKRTHTQGLHLLRVLGSMWSFLGGDAQRKQTSVPPNLLLRLQPPEKPLAPIVRPQLSVIELFKNDREDSRRDVPSPLMMGRAIAIARSGALNERASLAVQLLAGSLQRRRAIIGSHRMDFKIMGEWDDPETDILWVIPPFMRKRSNKRRADLPHEVVLVDSTAKVVLRLDKLTRGENPHYFPVRGAPGKKTKNPYADPSFINHALQYMPNVDMSPHA
jgi:hypothetical protein